MGKARSLHFGKQPYDQLSDPNRVMMFYLYFSSALNLIQLMILPNWLKVIWPTFTEDSLALSSSRQH